MDMEVHSPRVVRSSARLSRAARAADGSPGSGSGDSSRTSGTVATVSHDQRVRRRARAAAVAAAAAARGARAERAARAARAAERAREVEEPPEVVRAKVRRLARAVAAARHLVVYTGAGISTAAAIPDYRGPRGVWTRLRRGERVARVEVWAARPTLTHMTLAALWRRGALRFVVSQNCDGLHLRSGLPRAALAELHGDMFVEHCAAAGCGASYLRAFDTTERTARARHRTRRLCHRCGAELRDSIVHFGERGRARWPLNWSGALRHAARADVVLCLGSSLKVLRRYPRLWGRPRRRPKLYIVNLQWTPKDSAAALKISARCDDVMRELARQLRLRVPRYRARRDPLYHHHTPLSPRELHTTRRPMLRAPPAAAPSASSSSSAADASTGSASDSDDDRPLRQVADKMRRRDADSLRTFQVQMCSGEATILMRARHAPSAPPPASPPPPAPPPSHTGRPPPPPPPPPPPAAPPAHLPNGVAKVEPASPGGSSPRPLSDLRQFRRLRPADRPNGYVNGHAVPVDLRRETGAPIVKREATSDDEAKPDPALEDRKPDLGGEDRKPELGGEDRDRKPDVKVEGGVAVKREPGAASADEPRNGELAAANSAVMQSCVSLARAIIAHAMLVCRASLYPGLHTIIPAPPAEAAPAPPAPAAPRLPRAPKRRRSPAAGDECAWCRRRFGAARCLFYRPHDVNAGSRAERTVEGRRYMCACCGGEDEPSATRAASPAPAGADTDRLVEAGGGGWYGKGYRKGRRRKR